MKTVEHKGQSCTLVVLELEEAGSSWPSPCLPPAHTTTVYHASVSPGLLTDRFLDGRRGGTTYFGFSIALLSRRLDLVADGTSYPSASVAMVTGATYASSSSWVDCSGRSDWTDVL
eukprot:m.320962 g.320962  ORF g.320962 m.320962 type:complete len:116 (-) comp27590_c0_seq5:1863-2210(-)